MIEPAKSGQVITFYSYKGGTGRSMALANVACVLAEKLPGDRSVLLVDWDLEAPGLHRFFPGSSGASASDTSLGLDHRPGLIDLFWKLHELTPKSKPESEDEAESRATHALAAVGLENFVIDSGVNGIRLLRAGRDDDGRYAERVNTFQWAQLFDRSPLLFRALSEHWALAHQHVLIDSRTGIGDISGICTALMPDRLVVVFTPNRQSLTGIKALMESATTYRRKSDDLRPLVVFPLPSRIEGQRDAERAQWRMGNQARGIIGFQPMFEELLANIYALPECKLDTYFNQTQIQQTPDYAYGEQIAVLTEQTTDHFALNSTYRVFTDWLTNAPGPWRRQTGVDTLIETLKERVGADSLGQEQRRELEEIVNKLEETVKQQDSTGVSPPTSGPPTDGMWPALRYDVYLSHARSDTSLALDLARELQRHGLTVYLGDMAADGSALQLARPFVQAIRTSRFVTVLWSESSARSLLMQEELRLAFQRSKVFFVRLDNAVLPREVHQGLPVFDLQLWAKSKTLSDLAPLLALLRPQTVAARASIRGKAWTVIAGVLISGILFTLGMQLFPYTDKPADPTTLVMPTVVGQPLKEGLEILVRAGLKVGRTDSQTVSDAEAGTILGQSVKPGEQVGRGAEINIVIATPPPSPNSRPVPNGQSKVLDAPEVVIRKLTAEINKLGPTEKLGGEVQRKAAAWANNEMGPYFLDVVPMARRLVGPDWDKATDEQRNALVHEARKEIARNYLTTLAKFSRHSIQRVDTLIEYDNTVIVKSFSAAQPKGSSEILTYHMIKTEAGWRIDDIRIQGNSLVDQYAFVFRGEIKEGGIDGLIRALTERNKTTLAHP